MDIRTDIVPVVGRGLDSLPLVHKQVRKKSWIWNLGTLLIGVLLPIRNSYWMSKQEDWY